MKALKSCLLLLILFLPLDFFSQSYAQDSCSAPSCPTLTITGSDKVSYGQSVSYTLEGASSDNNIKWSVDNPNASITGKNSGATLTVGNACDCNSGAITITAKDTRTGCSATYKAQAGTWVQVASCSYGGSCRIVVDDRGSWSNVVGTDRLDWAYPIEAFHEEICYPPPYPYDESIMPERSIPKGRNVDKLCQDYSGCGCTYTTHPGYLRWWQYNWRCSTSSSQTCTNACSLSISDFKSSADTIDVTRSENVCLSGVIDSNNSATWTIEIKNSAGDTVNSFSGSDAYASASWDGKDGRGNIAASGTYTAKLTATSGQCTDSREVSVAVKSCDLEITKFEGTDATLNPSSGGTVELDGEISDSSGKGIEWTATITEIAYDGTEDTIKVYEGTGKTVTVLWDGLDSYGKVVDEGNYKADLTAKTEDGQCNDYGEIEFKVYPTTNQCSLTVDFGSSANVASGNLSHTQDIVSLKGAGLATNISLYYNSRDSHDGPLGKSWSHSYDITLKELSDGSVLVRDGSNKRSLYEKSNGGYTSQPGDYSAISKNTDGTFTVTHKDGTRYNFNGINKISSIVDRNGNTMNFVYSDDGDLTTITDSAGRTTTLAYNSDHRISTINDPNGNTHTFTYSGNDLIGVSTLNSELGTLNWVYSYHDNSFMKTKTDPNGYTTTYTYDENYRVVTSTDPEGSVKSIAYPSHDDTSETKTTTVTEKDGGNWTYSYDTQAGTLTQKTDPEDNTTSYAYDESRNMTSKTEPDGSVTSYTYDSSGNMTSQTDALNQTTSYTYNSYGQATSITAPDGTTTTYEYDTNGNLTKTTDSTGASTSYQYDSKGNITQITNSAGQTTTFTYDQSGNLSSIKDSTGATTSFTYDTAGNMTSQTDALGNTTTYVYDSLGHLTQLQTPNSEVTTFSYDANGNKTSETDANGNTTYYEYNYKGQLTKVTDALGNIATYTYGGTGCSSCGGGTDKLTAVTDANGNATKYEYDTLGRLIKETDPLGNSISYSYDSNGNLISKTDANGATTSYSYDSLDRLLKKVYPDNTTETYTYDSKGNILTATNSNISYSLSYNTNGKVTSVTDSSGRAVSYQYDSLGNKTKLTYPEGSTAAYSYDSANRLTNITNGEGKTYTFTYDSIGRRTKLSLPNGAYASYSYDNSGRLTSLTHKTSSGSTIASFTYTHDKVGNRLTKALDTGTNYTYSYDAIYRLAEALSSTPGYSSNTNSKGSGTTTATEQQKEYFTYDPVGNRLTSDKYSSYTYNQANQLLSNGGTYSYDKNGNLTSKIDGSTTYSYSYDYENRLTKVIKTESGATTTSEYKYDPFGRRIERKVTESGTATTTKYVYDNEDIILEYDGSGNTGNRYVHGPGIDEPLAVVNGKNNYYYHADGLGSIVALTDSNGKSQQTYEYDSFGNLKDQKNKVKQPYTFTGREWDKEAGLYYYRARYYDPKIGRFISFDPIVHPAYTKQKSCGIKRLVQPVGVPSFDELKKDPLSLNQYTYVKNNPLRWLDPLGLACGTASTDAIIPDSYGAFDFTSPCTNHDTCYGTCGKSKSTCDLTFFTDMMSECSKLTFYPISQFSCIETAVTYYAAVVTFGGSAYDNAQKEACCK